MKELDNKVSENILESYNGKIDNIYSKMNFSSFGNRKLYSFDYHLKSDFDTLMEKLNNELKENKLKLSPMLSNKIPIFLPKETKRIAFFTYASKSVREVKINELESILTKMAEKKCRAERLPDETAKKMVQEDLDLFNTYQSEHNFEAYRRDIFTKATQFNAYDDKDNLLLEKSFVKGGLVFDMDPKDFFNLIKISYPQYRKQRSDKKSDYLPLKLINIRGIRLKKEEAS